MRTRSLFTAVLAGVALFATPLAAQQRQADAGVTFTKDVAPILQRSCVNCHRAGQIAPMSLRTYEEVRPWARSIKTRVAARSMPPWHIDKNVGIQEFKDDLSLPDKDIATIVAWVDAGAPRGNPADMPAQRDFADGDAVGHRQAGSRRDVPGPQGAADRPGPVSERHGADRADGRPLRQGHPDASDRRQVAAGRAPRDHHDASGRGGDADPNANPDSPDGGGTQFIIEYASGKAPEIYPENSGILLKAGSTLSLANHLHSIGEEVDLAGRGRVPAVSEG